MNVSTKGITLLGLGPGDPALLTLQAQAHLAEIGEIYVRTRMHPALEGFPPHLVVHSFDDLYTHSEAFEAVYTGIVERILELGRDDGGVTYAVPGHPFVAESTGPEIARRARQEGIPLRVIEGISFLEPVVSALGIDPFSSLVLVDALELGGLHTPNFPPHMPALVAQIYNRQTASEVKLTLNAVYPDRHPVQLVHAAGTSDVRVENLMLYEIDRSPSIGLLTALYVPPLENDTSLEGFQEIVAHLRAPDGCPWDREQTIQSMANNLLEETYEALEAIDEGDMDALAEELGDLMLILTMYAQIGSEEGYFDMARILQGIHRKIVRRHPHVFGEIDVEGTQEVLRNWETIKAAERKQKGELKAEKGILDGVGKALPALTRAQEFQDRAAHVGFDWPDIQGVKEKLLEEWREVELAIGEALELEIGDLLFSVVNLARWHKVDAETALRKANQRFLTRFRHIERRSGEQGRKLTELSLEEMERFWQEGKRL